MQNITKGQMSPLVQAEHFKTLGLLCNSWTIILKWGLYLIRWLQSQRPLGPSKEDCHRSKHVIKQIFNLERLVNYKASVVPVKLNIREYK